MRPLAALLLLLLIALPSAAQSVDIAPTTASGRVIRDIVESGRLDDLRWPDFGDYRNHLRNFYGPTGYRLAWSKDRKATAQARAVITLFESADWKGINSVDYDGPRWAERLATVAVAPNEAELAKFDAAVTVSLMRYISDLHIGRINPRHVRFELDIATKKYYLPKIVSEVMTAADPTAMLATIEPPFAEYRKLQTALARYRRMLPEAERDTPLPAVKGVKPGDKYSGVPQLARMLRRYGDLTADFDETRGVYDGALVDAAKRFQLRHGLDGDGVLGARAFAQLNVPLSRRVKQIVWALERWRWMPVDFDVPPIVVNIPEYRLRAWDAAGRTAMSMRVVVGSAYNHQTPIFDGDMKYVVFRPYWNVPPSIQRAELAPKLEKNRYWLARNGYELVTANGKVIGTDVVDGDTLRRIRSVDVRIRQKPGPGNALGAVKFIFPNENNVYLHSTPSQSLFSRERRDFSHGCIRVEDPVALASWVLQGSAEWTPEKIRAAMNGTAEDVHVRLPKPLPVLIIYATAVATDEGGVQFFEDIYGHDATLENALAGGYPYPS
jgi:murein L,D-transpeptidase YcbB/YkuD